MCNIYRTVLVKLSVIDLNIILLNIDELHGNLCKEGYVFHVAIIEVVFMHVLSNSMIFKK
jgi:hypothetical protein